MVATRTLMPYAAVLAAALTLGACSGGDPTPPSWASTANGGEPTSATSGSVPPSGAPSSSAAPTAAEDPVLARIPKEARAETEQGAEAFSAYFFTTLNQAAAAGDPTGLHGLSTDDCKTCAAITKSIDALQAKGQHHKGDTISVSGTETVSHGNGRATVKIPVIQNAVEVLDRSGRVVDRTEGDKGAFVATLAYARTHWVITKLQAMPS